MSTRLQTLLAGIIVLLPIAATLAIVGWVGSFIYSWFGPGSTVGRILTSIGIGLVDSPLIAYLIGIVVVAGCVYLLGAVVESKLQPRILGLIDSVMLRIPLVGNVYDISKRFVSVMHRTGGDELQSMSPVWCFIGGEGSAVVLALLPRPEPVIIDGEPYRVVLVPFAPVPFGGTLVYVPAKWVVPAEMRVEHLMSTYVSMGVSSPDKVPGLSKSVPLATVTSQSS
jgi:uncharacterized membrane protein